jgi:fatty acid desaturase
MIYLRAAMAALSAAGLLTKLLVAAGLVVALLTAYGVWHHKVYQSGYVRAIADIAAEDKRAVDRAIAARSAWKDCRAAGRRWDQVEGRCL